MKVLDLGYGTGSATRAWADHGHEVVGVDREGSFNPTIHGDWGDDCTWKRIDERGPYDFIWFSPDCSIFSILRRDNPFDKSGLRYDAARRHRVPRTYTPNTDQAREEVRKIEWVIMLIEEMSPPKGWVMENPRAIMRRMDFVKGLRRTTVCYCRYGDTRRKPTDLFGNIPLSFIPRTCKTGDPCHIHVKKGEKNPGGSIALNKVDAGRVPYGLSLALFQAAMDDSQMTLLEFL